MAISLGRVFDAIRAVVPPADAALIHGDHVTSWGDFHRRTDALAASFLAGGAVAGDKVALLLRNGPAYAEVTVAALKARLVHVNINYRYIGEELFYILDNSDAVVLVHDAEFAPLVASLSHRLPRLAQIIEVGPAFEAAATGDAVLPPQDHDLVAEDQQFDLVGRSTPTE